LNTEKLGLTTEQLPLSSQTKLFNAQSTTRLLPVPLLSPAGGPSLQPSIVPRQVIKPSAITQQESIFGCRVDSPTPFLLSFRPL
jgi:hypothetical protein